MSDTFSRTTPKLGFDTALAAEKPKLAEQLLSELTAWRQAVGADSMQPNPAYDPTVKPVKKRKQKGNKKAQAEAKE